MTASKQLPLEKNRLLRVIKTWVSENKKAFWKYEVSCFYKTYFLRVGNLPRPAAEDIVVSSNDRLLTGRQKKQLCDAVKKIYAIPSRASVSSINVQIDYDNGVIINEVS
ncbi:MAG TPA: hypothetical protein PK926_17735 [Spirochaetota bacterium]|nr:hypothetical protein [Spirochaetota bacterium]HPI91319.1 hypothetical protein [Spirochaetota bacterium]HPR50054.1 hypothetical protein [Spirochaetota bacterium]